MSLYHIFFTCNLYAVWIWNSNLEMASLESRPFFHFVFFSFFFLMLYIKFSSLHAILFEMMYNIGCAPRFAISSENEQLLKNCSLEYVKKRLIHFKCALIYNWKEHQNRMYRIFLKHVTWRREWLFGMLKNKTSPSWIWH